VLTWSAGVSFSGTNTRHESQQHQPGRKVNSFLELFHNLLFRRQSWPPLPRLDGLGGRGAAYSEPWIVLFCIGFNGRGNNVHCCTVIWAHFFPPGCSGSSRMKSCSESEVSEGWIVLGEVYRVSLPGLGKACVAAAQATDFPELFLPKGSNVRRCPRVSCLCYRKETQECEAGWQHSLRRHPGFHQGPGALCSRGEELTNAECHRICHPQLPPAQAEIRQ